MMDILRVGVAPGISLMRSIFRAPVDHLKEVTSLSIRPRTSLALSAEKSKTLTTSEAHSHNHKVVAIIQTWQQTFRSPPTPHSCSRRQPTSRWPTLGRRAGPLTRLTFCQSLPFQGRLRLPYGRSKSLNFLRSCRLRQSSTSCLKKTTR